MKIDFDPATGERVIRANAEDIGLLVYAVDMALQVSRSTQIKKEMTELRERLIDSSKQEEIDPFVKRMNTYWENPR